MKIEKYEDYVISRILIAYLIEGKSHRQIQREVLGIPAPAKGGGFITMQILHHFNIKGNAKGALKTDLSRLQEFNSHARNLVERYLKISNEAEAIIEKKINPNERPTIRDVKIKARVYQDVLKRHVVKNYKEKCALCEIDQPELLVASHIIPWNIDESKRLELDNCILFCVFHDKLFDRGLISFDEKSELKISRYLNQSVMKYIGNLVLRTPLKSFPKPEYLRWHFEEIFRNK